MVVVLKINQELNSMEIGNSKIHGKLKELIISDCYLKNDKIVVYIFANGVLEK